MSGRSSLATVDAGLFVNVACRYSACPIVPGGLWMGYLDQPSLLWP